MRFHWQNLNDDYRGRPKGWPHHGRAWLHVGRVTFKFEWALGSLRLGAGLHVDPSEHGLMLSLGFLLGSIYLGVEHLPFPRRFFERFKWEDWDVFSVGVHDWSLWWRFWATSMSWSSKTPRWRDGSWKPGRTFFGKWIYETRVVENRRIVVPMPEGEYPGSAELRYAIRGHRFSPLKHRNYEVEIKLDEGIPFSGKGENSWGCGKDGTWGVTGPARTIDQAIGQLVGSVLETRAKRGDPAKWPEAPGATS